MNVLCASKDSTSENAGATQAGSMTARAVSVGLVFDLLSKSRLNLGMAGIGALSSRPANAELAVLQRLWDSLSLTLQQIAVQPMQGLQQIQENRLCWGSERLSVAGLRQLAMSGVDPRRGDVARPFYAMRDRLRETYDIAEHRIILGFLRLIIDRTLDCGWRAEQQVVFIKKDQPYRDIDQSDGSNLFRDIDGPKMQRLQHASARAKELVERIRQAERIEFLRRIQPELRPPYSPIFTNVLPYKRFRDEMLRYLGASLAILDEGLEERAKSTSRMYEQWIFLQVLAALRACGLRPISQQGLLTRARRHRFMIDIERGTRVSFLSADHKNISVRYEPWIHPVALARYSHESVYRGRSGENSWSPDILIEVMEDIGEKEKLSGVEYAIVIDAKYTAQISPRHKESVSKYNEIRDTVTNRPVVKQVWLAHPGESGITPWDDAIEWTSQGPSRPRNEVINGTLGILPPTANPGAPQGRLLNETALEFTKGLLAYLGIHAESKLASV